VPRIKPRPGRCGGAQPRECSARSPGPVTRTPPEVVDARRAPSVSTAAMMSCLSLMRTSGTGLERARPKGRCRARWCTGGRRRSPERRAGRASSQMRTPARSAAARPRRRTPTPFCKLPAALRLPPWLTQTRPTGTCAASWAGCGSPGPARPSCSLRPQAQRSATVRGRPEITFAGCIAHLRRKLCDAAQVKEPDAASPLALVHKLLRLPKDQPFQTCVKRRSSPGSLNRVRSLRSRPAG